MGHVREHARDRPARRRDGPKPEPGPLPKSPVAETASPAVAVGLARAGGRLSVEQVESLQRAVGNAAVTAVIQRDEPTPTSHPAVNLDLGWLDDNAKVSTNGQIVAAAHLGIGTLESALPDIESDQVKTDVQEWVDTVRGALPYFERHESEAINDGMVPLINHQIDRFAAIRAEIQDDKDSRLRAALNAELRAAEKAADEAEAMQPALAEAMRAAFRKGSSHTVKDTLSMVKTSLSMGRSIRSLARSITTDLSALGNAVDAGVPALSVPSGTVMTVDRWSSEIGQVRVTVVNVGKYTEMLGTLGRGLSAINIAFTVADRSTRATEGEQAMKDLNDVVNVSTDLASLSSASMPPHFSLMTALYIKPALKVISKQIGALVEQLSEENRVSVAVTGDLMYPNAEPGRQPMFDFMLEVMHASDASGVPPIDDDVEDYLYDHRDKLEAGAEEEVPTSGWWLWNSLDTAAARRWVFDHRQSVWNMFYGSMPVPTRR
jgi:hypothetical protein